MHTCVLSSEYVIYCSQSKTVAGKTTVVLDATVVLPQSQQYAGMPSKEKKLSTKEDVYKAVSLLPKS